MPGQLNPSVGRDLAIWPNVGLFLGVGTYAYEAVASLYTVRNSMQKPKLLPNLIV